MEYLKMLVFLFFSLFSQEKVEYMLPNIVDVQQIVEVTPQKVLLVNEGDILQLDVLGRKVKKVGKRNGNEFVGYDGGLLFCKIEHYIIDSEDEFSTKFTVLDEEKDVVRELQFFETIRPLYIDNNIIVATTAIDFLGRHFYKISVESGEMKEIFLEDLGQKKNITNVREDVFGNVWVSFSTKKVVLTHILTHLSGLILQLEQLGIYQKLSL
ncbi:MAG TPA: hypothetical protein PKI16_01745 [Candidatus Dojkabacteria bacterium]|nr:hypothetical protein [Candidatus Dojkabacteria bacterium]